MNAVITVLNEFGAPFLRHAGSMFVQAGVLIVALWIPDRIFPAICRLRSVMDCGCAFS